MSDLSRRAAALREALTYAEVPQFRVEGSQVEILVYESVSLARLRQAARAVGVPDEAYQTRASQLTTAGVALWDVLKHCQRVGSLDTRIIPRTEVPNDIAELLKRHPTFNRIVFNGQKAERSFNKLVKPGLPLDAHDRVSTAVAPSTSPANARLTLPALVEAWRAALNLTA